MSFSSWAVVKFDQKLDMMFIKDKINQVVAADIKNQRIWDVVPNLSCYSYFHKIASVEKLSIQLPYQDIVEMMERVLERYQYPDIKILKYLVWFYDLLDDNHKAIIEPVLYGHCKREERFNYFRNLKI